jgi:hypothetical protein
MVSTEHIPMMIIGAVFLISGIILLIIGTREEKKYLNNISNSVDVRKYLEHKSDNTQSWGFKVGGIVGALIGLSLLVMGLVFWIRG